MLTSICVTVAILGTNDYHSPLRDLFFNDRIHRIKPAPDVNRDGYGDYVVISTKKEFQPCFVVICSGLDGSVLHRYMGPKGYGMMADVGDVDGSGAPELIHSLVQFEESKVVASNLDRTHVLWVAHAPEDVWVFGAGITILQDLVLVQGRIGSAGCLVVLDKGTGDVLFVHEDPLKRGTNFADWHGSAGDVNGDGIEDYWAGRGNRYPRVWIYSGLDHSLIRIVPHGPEIAPLGDINGDKCDDVAHADDRTVRAYSGRDGSVLWDLPHPPGHSFVPSLARLGDSLLIVYGGIRPDFVLDVSRFDGRIIDRVEDELQLGRGIEALGDLTGDGNVEWVIHGGFPDDNLWGWRIYSRNALTDVHLEGTDFLVNAPSCGGLPFALIAAYSKDTGTWIGGRPLDLDPDPLLAFTLTHPLWGRLDEAGRATLKVPDWLSAMGGPAIALLILDPRAPQGIRAITNSRLLSTGE